MRLQVIYIPWEFPDPSPISTSFILLITGRFYRFFKKSTKNQPSTIFLQHLILDKNFTSGFKPHVFVCGQFLTDFSFALSLGDGYSLIKCRTMM